MQQPVANQSEHLFLTASARKEFSTDLTAMREHVGKHVQFNMPHRLLLNRADTEKGACGKHVNLTVPHCIHPDW